MSEHTLQRWTLANLRAAGAWIGVALCVFFGLFAIGVVITEGFRYFADGDSNRAVPPLFLAHALSGSIALIAGALQLRLVQRLLRARPRVHRYIGRTYVAAALTTSIGSVPVIAGFDVPLLAKFAFACEAILWFGATSMAYRKIRKGLVNQHREWMIRSYALALFFVSGGVWLDVFEGSALYPLGVFLSWAPNLLVAELWIRRSPPPVIARQLDDPLERGIIAEGRVKKAS